MPIGDQKTKLFRKRALWLLLLCTLSGHAFAVSKFIDSVNVTRIGTYQHNAGHFVWLSVVVPECSTPLTFNETQPGGKALFTTLAVALINKRKIGVRYDGCDIIEAYLK